MSIKTPPMMEPPICTEPKLLGFSPIPKISAPANNTSTTSPITSDSIPQFFLVFIFLPLVKAMQSIDCKPISFDQGSGRLLISAAGRLYHQIPSAESCKKIIVFGNLFGKRELASECAIIAPLIHATRLARGMHRV